MVEIVEYTGELFQVVGFFGAKVSNVSPVKPAEVDGAKCWLAQVDGDPAGMALVDGDILRRIGVADEYRGQGIGRQLAEHAVAHHGQLRARVKPEKTDAKRFYDALGWELVSDEGSLHEYESR